MLINAQTAISTSSVLLVPYSKKHVPRYHEWMKDEEIQKATASEPLTLEEEYGMQKSWRQDADKLTFIICCPLLEPRTERISDEDDNPDRMLGDVNLFLRIEDSDSDSDSPSSSVEIIGEIELMIAEKKHQRNGFGRASLLSFLRYISTHERDILDEYIQNDPLASQAIPGFGVQERDQWRFTALSVKIGKSNTGSLALFETLGFRRVSDEPNYFGEFELRRKVPGRDDCEAREYAEAVYIGDEQ